MDCNPPGSSVQGILQASILDWVAMPSSREIFLTQGSNPCLLHLLHYRWILYHGATGKAPKEFRHAPIVQTEKQRPTEGQRITQSKSEAEPRQGCRAPDIYIYLTFIYLAVPYLKLQHAGSSIFLEACRIFCCSMWDLVP